MTSYTIVQKYIETRTNVSGYDRIFPHWKLKIDMSENGTSHLVVYSQARSVFIFLKVFEIFLSKIMHTRVVWHSMFTDTTLRTQLVCT